MTSEESHFSGEEACGLAGRFSSHLANEAVLKSGDRVVVALSGGGDSTVLLHLLRFTPNLPPVEIVAAHFDHAMRPESGREALWVKGVCHAWRVPIRFGRAGVPPTSEEGAREERFKFLFEEKERERASWVLTGHHGDDQAETVLFRILRGTGVGGLAGIPVARHPGVYRPLLPFFREELEDYAERHKLRYLSDPSNQDLAHPRNFLRHEVFPRLREGPIPGARESLLRLAKLAQENEEAWERVLPALLDQVLGEDESGEFIVRSTLLAYHPALQSKLLRRVLLEAGIQLDEAGTRAALEFTRTGVSGGGLSLAGGTRFVRDFDRFRLARTESPGESESLGIPEPIPGSGKFTAGGMKYLAEWGDKEPVGYDKTVQLPVSALGFPLQLRGWVPGDRISLSYGTKKLKKLFAEARVPSAERVQIPLLADREGRILWVAGLATSSLTQSHEAGETLFLGIKRDIP